MNADSLREYKARKAREYYARHRERILKRNKTSRVRAYKAKWSASYRKKNIELVRERNNAWVSARRKEWLRKHGPCAKCGSTKRLEVDHMDPKKKIHHSVWTWGEARREKELKKCQVLCFLCHRLKTNKERGWKLHGEIRWQMGCRCAECVRVHKKKLRKLRRGRDE